MTPIYNRCIAYIVVTMPNENNLTKSTFQCKLILLSSQMANPKCNDVGVTLLNLASAINSVGLFQIGKSGPNPVID